MKRDTETPRNLACREIFSHLMGCSNIAEMTINGGGSVEDLADAYSDAIALHFRMVCARYTPGEQADFYRAFHIGMLAKVGFPVASVEAWK